MPMDVSHIWLGQFPSEEALDRYFEETYDDDAPINQFAADQGTAFYDHDWVEYGFNSLGSLRDLVEPHSYSVDSIEQVIEAGRSGPAALRSPSASTSPTRPPSRGPSSG